jgi:hypothetical protein
MIVVHQGMGGLGLPRTKLRRARRAAKTKKHKEKMKSPEQKYAELVARCQTAQTLSRESGVPLPAECVEQPDPMASMPPITIPGLVDPSAPSPIPGGAALYTEPEQSNLGPILLAAGGGLVLLLILKKRKAKKAA